MPASTVAVDIAVASVYLGYDFGAIWFLYAGLAGSHDGDPEDTPEEPEDEELWP